MSFTTIISEGNLIPADLLERIATGDTDGQQSTDFGLDKSTRLTDEIATAWSDARAFWDVFGRSLRRLREDDPATTTTRERWIVPLLELLGYTLTYMPTAAVVEQRTYAISHRAGSDESAPPVHIEGARRSLDLRAASGRPRLSPHALVQEYLNSTEHLWGIVTNGYKLRLLRDSSRTSRPTYVEFDLQAMLDGEKFSEFALLYRLLHRTRLPQTIDDAPRCLLERYHQQAIEAGGRVREGLRNGVETALRAMGNGLLQHPDSTALRTALASGTLSQLDYYRELLRLVYRLLFLMVAEERGLVSGTEQGLAIYHAYYSVSRLRRLAEKPGAGRGRHSDLWQGLLATFRIFEDDDAAQVMGVTALDGDLFGPEAIKHLEQTGLANATLLAAIHALSLYRDPQTKALRRINYSALDVEELGSVYESLLDYRPLVQTRDDQPAFDLVTGTERKTTGSYYTRPELVQELIKSALEPVLADRLAAAGSDPVARERAILRMTVCDPACGSGHFLLAAARCLGRELARVRSGEDQPAPEQFRRAVRDVIAHCIYGVDANPLAVDLCKLALWIEGFNAGMPLSFLDSHIRWGNSLIGARRDLIEHGIPDDAFQPVTGDDKAAASAIRKRNAKERKAHESGQAMLPLDYHTDRHDTLVRTARALDDAPDTTVQAVRAKARQFNASRGPGSAWYDEWTRYNLWTAAFFLPLTSADDPAIPTTQTVLDFERNPASVHGMAVGAANGLSQELGFFQWELEFAQVFGEDGSGGFDVVLGNPPWERIKLQEEEFFASYDPDIANAANKAARKKLIDALAQTNPRLAILFQQAKHYADAQSKFVRESGRFPLTAVGDVNTYALFSEHARRVVNKRGRAGIIVPTGIATDDTTKAFFGDLSQQRQLVSLYDFENRENIFPGVGHGRYKFCLLTTGATQQPTKFSFFATNIKHLNDELRIFELTPEDIALLNPNTFTCPIFRTTIDAELTKKIYRRVPVLVNECIGQNPWNIRFMTMFHMSGDSELFKYEVAADRTPLYEAKLFHHYNHRFGDYADYPEGALTSALPEIPSARLQNPRYSITPRYWVARDEVEARLAGRWDKGWLLGFRNITNATNERTAIFSLLPKVAVGHSMPLMLPGISVAASQTSCLLAIFDSLSFDYIVRQKVGGTNLTYGYLYQLPVLPPSAFSAADIAFISERVLELVYTAWDMQPFAADVWAELDEAGRARVLARNAECNRDAPADLFAPCDGFQLPPFRWNEERRAQIRAELDARIARLYGLTRDELRYILDPADVYGPDFPGETFRVLKEKEIRQYGEYRTRRLVLAAWDAEEARRQSSGVDANATMLVGTGGESNQIDDR